jgi:hypothetical protein
MCTIFLWQIANIVSSGIQPLHNLTVLVSILCIMVLHIEIHRLACLRFINKILFCVVQLCNLFATH